MKRRFMNHVIETSLDIIENEYTSFVESRLNSQNTDDEMIKQDHENESSQTIFA